MCSRFSQLYLCSFDLGAGLADAELCHSSAVRRRVSPSLPAHRPTGCLPWPHLLCGKWFCPPMQCPGLGRVAGGGCPSSLFLNPRGDPSRNLPRSQSRGSSSPLPHAANTRKGLREGVGQGGLRTPEEAQLERGSSRWSWWSPPVRGFSTSNPGDHTSFHSLLNM